MTDDTEPRLSRREFFRTAGRRAALGGLAVLATVLLLRGRGAGADDCDLPTCGRCGRLAGCELPQARAKRRGEPRQ